MLCMSGQLSSRVSVVDDDNEDKVSADALEKLGLLQNYFSRFPTFLSVFSLVYSLARFAT